jgi:hypothetical protein
MGFQALLGAEMPAFPGWEFIVPCFSLPMLGVGAVVGATVAYFFRASRFHAPTIAGAVGGVLGGWLAFVPFPMLFPDARNAPANGTILGTTVLGVSVGSSLLSGVVALWGKSQKPPSSGL